MVTKADVQQAIQALGLANQPLGVHASLRSFGWVDGGTKCGRLPCRCDDAMLGGSLLS